MLNSARLSGSRSSMRALDVFQAYQKARRPLSLTELSQHAEIPVSTCHAVMKLLAQEGFLYFVSAREAYPTRLLWQIAEEIRRRDPMVEMLEAPLAALRDEVDETVLLGARQGDQVVYLLVLEGAQAIRYSSSIGAHKPLHSSAIGKLMLASLPTAALDGWLKGNALKRSTERTLTSAAALRDDLSATRERGYSITRGENVSDVMAMAAPVRLGGTLLGVAIAGPMPRMETRQAWLSRRLLQSTRGMEKLGAA
jgi:DNA-binding IclR family transcriptional regulator